MTIFTSTYILDKMAEKSGIPVVNVRIVGDNRVLIYVPYNAELIKKVKTISERKRL